MLVHNFATVLADFGSTNSSIDGSGLVHNLFVFLIIVICVAAIYFVGCWFLKMLEAPPIALKLWTGLFVLLGLVVFLNFVLSLIGKPFIRW